MRNSKQVVWIWAGLTALVLGTACGTPSVPAHDSTLEPPAFDPVVTSVSPARISAGHTVTIRGEHIELVDTVVEIDGQVAEIVSLKPNEIAVRGVPAVAERQTATLQIVQEGRASEPVEITLIPSGTVSVRQSQLPVEPRYTAAIGDTVYFTDAAGLFAIGVDGTVAPVVGTTELNDPEGIAVSPDGRLAVVNRTPDRLKGDSGSLWLVDPASRECELVVDGLIDPTALAIDSNGTYYVLEATSDRVRTVSGSPAQIGELATVSSAPYGADLAVANGYLYLSSWSDSQILRVPVGGGAFEPFAVVADYPQGLYSDGQHVLATGFFPTYGATSIVELDTATGSLTSAVAFDEIPFAAARDITFAGGAYFVTDSATATVMRVDSAQDMRPVAAGLYSPVGLVSEGGTTWFAVAPRCTTVATDALVRLDADGTSRVVSTLRCPAAIARQGHSMLAITHDVDFLSSVVRVNADGTHTTVIPVSEDFMFSGLTSNGGSILVSDSDNNVLIQYDASGVEVASVTLDPASGIGALLARGDDLYVADDAPAVYRRPVALTEGTPSLVADGAQLSEPRSLGFDADGQLLISDPDQGALLRVDSAGTVSTLAQFAEAPGMTTLDPDGSILVVSLERARIYEVAP